MMKKELLDTMITAKENYEAAVRNHMGVEKKRLVLTNILISHVGEIVDTLQDADDLYRQLIACRSENEKLKAQSEVKGVSPDDNKSRASKTKANG